MRKLIVASTLALLAAVTVSAQKTTTNVVYYGKPPLIDWEQAISEKNRYTIGVRPLMLFYDGLGFDFEMELPKPGNWLQFSFKGYFREGEIDNDNQYYTTRRNMLTDWDSFGKFGGAGIGFAYKKVFTGNGWYVSVGLDFDYYRLHFNEKGYVPFVEEGKTYYKEQWGVVHRDFFKPQVNLNIGKHFALGKFIYLDCWAGIGITYSFYDGYPIYNDNIFSVGYRGFTFSSGVKLGFLIGD